MVFRYKCNEQGIFRSIKKKLPLIPKLQNYYSLLSISFLLASGQRIHWQDHEWDAPLNGCSVTGAPSSFSGLPIVTPTFLKSNKQSKKVATPQQSSFRGLTPARRTRENDTFSMPWPFPVAPSIRDDMQCFFKWGPPVWHWSLQQVDTGDLFFFCRMFHSMNHKRLKDMQGRKEIAFCRGSNNTFVLETTSRKRLE